MVQNSFTHAAATPQQAYRLAEQLFEVIQDHGSVTRAAALVKAGADLEARFGGTRDTALQRAILCRQDDIALYLIDNGSDLTSPALGGGANPLIYSAMFGDFDDVMKKLLSKGVPADCRPTDDAKTALMWAAENGKWSRARLLIDHGADLTLEDEKGKTAVDYAQEKHGGPAARMLQAMYEAAHASDRLKVMRPLSFKKPPAPQPVVPPPAPAKARRPAKSGRKTKGL